MRQELNSHNLAGGGTETSTLARLSLMLVTAAAAARVAEFMLHRGLHSVCTLDSRRRFFRCCILCILDLGNV